MSKIFQFLFELINSDIIIAVVASSLAIFSGRFVYLKQKEYEEVQKRYLTNCIDLLCNNNDQVLAIFKHNWARSLQLIKQFRDADLIMKDEDYNNQFIPFDYTLTKIVPFERLKRLLNDNIFYEYSQQLWVFVDNSYSIFERDFKMALSHYINSDEKDSNLKKRIYDTYHKELVNLFDESRKFYVIIAMLTKISKFLEKEKFSYKKIYSFHKNNDIIEIVKNTKTHFKENINI